MFVPTDTASHTSTWILLHTLKDSLLITRESLFWSPTVNARADLPSTYSFYLSEPSSLDFTRRRLLIYSSKHFLPVIIHLMQFLVIKKSRRLGKIGLNLDKFLIVLQVTETFLSLVCEAIFVNISCSRLAHTSIYILRITKPVMWLIWSKSDPP